MNRSNPFSDFDAFVERMARSFDFDEMPRSRTGRWDWSVGESSFPMDLEDEGEAFVLTADLPGYEKSDIDVSVDGRTLTLSAHRERESEHEGDDEGLYIRRERRSESVSRSVRLPDDVDAESASATYTNGVLTVTVPKVHVDEDEGHRIDVE
jgi:HSP20 family protein